MCVCVYECACVQVYPQKELISNLFPVQLVVFPLFRGKFSTLLEVFCFKFLCHQFAKVVCVCMCVFVLMGVGLCVWVCMFVYVCLGENRLWQADCSAKERSSTFGVSTASVCVCVCVCL